VRKEWKRMLLLIDIVHEYLMRRGFQKETLDLLSTQNLFKLAEEYNYKVVVNDGSVLNA
jgi:hypothetical protein